MGLFRRGALLTVVVGIGIAGLLRFQQPAEPKTAPFEELRPGLFRHIFEMSPLPQIFQVQRSLLQPFERTGHSFAHSHAAICPAAGGKLAPAGS